MYHGEIWILLNMLEIWDLSHLLLKIIRYLFLQFLKDNFKRDITRRKSNRSDSCNLSVWGMTHLRKKNYWGKFPAVSNGNKLITVTDLALLRSVKQCLRDIAATVPCLCVLEGMWLKTSSGRLWYSKQAKNAVQQRQKPLYNIPWIHTLIYRERNQSNLKKNSASVP